MTGMFINALDHPSSIFGCGYSPYGMMNPMMMGMGGSLFGMGGMGCSSCCPTAMAANTGYQYGYMLGMQQNMINAAQAQQAGLTQYPALATNPYLQSINQNSPYLNLTNNEALAGTETDSWDDTKVDFKATK